MHGVTSIYFCNQKEYVPKRYARIISNFPLRNLPPKNKQTKCQSEKHQILSFTCLTKLAATMFRRLLCSKPVLVLPWKNFSITNVMSINKALDEARRKVVIKAPSRNIWDRKDWLTKQIWTIFFVFGCGTTAIVTCKCSPHTIFIQTTRDTFQQKIEKKPVELSEKLKGVVTNTLKGENFH